MLKGAQKKMIVVRTRDSRMFEEAYFVMRDSHSTADSRGDMLAEANRIIDGGFSSPAAAAEAPRRFTPTLRRLGWFLGGALCGGGAASLLFYLL